ncbi:hypothetical protein GCM10017687_59610 [Streptomyces echinatus]
MSRKHVIDGLLLDVARWLEGVPSASRWCNWHYRRAVCYVLPRAELETTTRAAERGGRRVEALRQTRGGSPGGGRLRAARSR